MAREVNGRRVFTKIDSAVLKRQLPGRSISNVTEHQTIENGTKWQQKQKQRASENNRIGKRAQRNEMKHGDIGGFQSFIAMK